MRIDKLISNSTSLSRKEIKSYIKKGLIVCNGEPVKNAELKVDEMTEAFETATTAAAYIDVVDAAIEEIATAKAEIGAVQSRLDSAAESLTTTIENTTASYSTIMDADIAEESAEFTKQQILQQSSAALLVQANQLPALALQLVQG